MAENYLRNAWYQAGWAHELGPDGSLARTILEIPILFYRDSRGELVALHDRCPHRFAPLSAGRIEGGVAYCGYHGLGFGADGACTHNPHGPVTSAMRVDSFPVQERHLAIWIWMGNPQAADPALIPPLPFIDATPETARIITYTPTAANYQLLTDNIMDLSHVDYLHPTTLGGAMVGAKSKSREEDGRVVAEWITLACDAPPSFQALVPSPAKADLWTQVSWSAPAIMVLGVSAVAAGQTRTSWDELYTLHSMTPETATTSHYFVCATRPVAIEDEGLTQMLRGALRQAFEDEDKPMLEKQQRRMGTADLWSLNPVLLPIDAAAVRVRRRLEALMKAEQAVAAE